MKQIFCWAKSMLGVYVAWNWDTFKCALIHPFQNDTHLLERLSLWSHIIYKSFISQQSMHNRQHIWVIVNFLYVCLHKQYAASLGFNMQNYIKRNRNRFSWDEFSLINLFCYSNNHNSSKIWNTVSFKCQLNHLRV